MNRIFLYNSILYNLGRSSTSVDFLYCSAFHSHFEPPHRALYSACGHIHTTQEKFKNGGFSLKTNQMFPSTLITPYEFKTATIDHRLPTFDLSLRKTRAASHRIIVTPSFCRSSVFNMFFSHETHENEKPAFSNSSGVFEERFRDELVWTVGLTVQIKLRFQMPSPLCVCCLKYTQISSINACLMFASLCYVTQNEFKI